jgi:hypothetical protein
MKMFDKLVEENTVKSLRASMLTTIRTCLICSDLNLKEESWFHASSKIMAYDRR